LEVGQGLVALLTFQKSINSCCLMILSDFVGSVVPGLHDTLCNVDSSVHQSEGMEGVVHIFECLKGPDLVQIPTGLICRCSISDNFRKYDIFVLCGNVISCTLKVGFYVDYMVHSKFLQ
jgi:hypothetical protein